MHPTICGVRGAEGAYPTRAGEYVRAMGNWFIMDPEGVLTVLSPQHDIHEHEDGTISVFPSIVSDKYHGFLIRGWWTANIPKPAPLPPLRPEWRNHFREWWNGRGKGPPSQYDDDGWAY